uniref:BRCT domain-containing protein n=1 Tax=Steinernema glaseri TaxID=37863 RepID=A0A1I7YM36_9BILA
MDFAFVDLYFARRVGELFVISVNQHIHDACSLPLPKRSTQKQPVYRLNPQWCKLEKEGKEKYERKMTECFSLFS